MLCAESGTGAFVVNFHACLFVIELRISALRVVMMPSLGQVWGCGCGCGRERGCYAGGCGRGRGCVCVWACCGRGCLCICVGVGVSVGVWVRGCACVVGDDDVCRSVTRF